MSLLSRLRSWLEGSESVQSPAPLNLIRFNAADVLKIDERAETTPLCQGFELFLAPAECRNPSVITARSELREEQRPIFGDDEIEIVLCKECSSKVFSGIDHFYTYAQVDLIDETEAQKSDGQDSRDLIRRSASRELVKKR